MLPNTPGRFKALARMIGSAGITTSAAPGKWSPRDIFCHLADCEIVFRLSPAADARRRPPCDQPFDQEKWAATYASVDANEALATFSLLRRWNLLLIEGALPAHAQKPVTHPERGEMTFSTIVETMAGHDLNHLGQLERIAGA